MLISMPTGTSTIFGVFQAILALLEKRTKFALPDKLMQIEKFASEIFCHKPRCLCCSANGIHFCVRPGCQTGVGSTRSGLPASVQMAAPARCGAMSSG
jgi:hypothetical protein